MKASVYLPNELETLVQTYLEEHPDLTLSSLVQRALENELKPRRNRLLELAGFVSFEPSDKRTPEQIAHDTHQRPEDEVAKHGLEQR